MDTGNIDNLITLNGNIPITLCDILKSDNQYVLKDDTYVVNNSECVKIDYYLSNSQEEKCIKSTKKPIMIYLKDKENIVINGNSSTFLADGKQIFIALDNCKNITFKNFTFDYVRPTVTELEVEDIGPSYIDVKFNRTTPFEIVDNKVKLIGPDQDYIINHDECLTQEYNPIENTTKRISTPIAWKIDIFENVIKAEKTGVDTARLFYIKMPPCQVGHIYEHRNLNRDACGFFINNSDNITFENITANFMHGLGVLAQLSKNIKIESCSFVPSNERKTTAFADMIHCVGCSSDIIIKNCIFDGAHDDAFNIHGIHQKITNVISPTQIEVTFMHKEAFGFKYYDINDEIEIVGKYSLRPIFKAKILDVKIKDKYTTILTIDSPINKKISILHSKYVIENVTKNTANVFYEGNVIKNIPTRGLLISTRGKVVIENNTFEKTQMSAILIADDASSWYESGQVKDVTIKDNNFILCKEPVINIKPEIRWYKGHIHENIKIINNKFDLLKETYLNAYAVKNLVVKDNKIDIDNNDAKKARIKLRKCTKVVLTNNFVDPI